MAKTDYWFEKKEYVARLARVQSMLLERGYDGLVSAMPETVTWTTGFFTRGYGSFQCAVVPAEGVPTMVCRDVEEYYLDTTCVFPARALWRDSDDPIEVAAGAVRSALGQAPRLAVELAAWPLNAARFRRLQELVPNAEWHDESRAVAALRFIKSPDEIAYQKRAGRAAELGMSAAVRNSRVGVSERELAAKVCAAMIRAGSDLPGPGVMSSGERALHLHGGYSSRVLKRGDIVQIETTPNVRHYHARFMRPIRVSEPQAGDFRTVEKLIEIQDAALAEVRPGVAAEIPDQIYREGVLSAGLRESYTNKTFYSIGLLLHPSGGEPLEAAPGCSWKFEPGMTFHTYVLAKGFGMSESIAVTESGYERLTDFERRLFVT